MKDGNVGQRANIHATHTFPVNAINYGYYVTLPCVIVNIQRLQTYIWKSPKVSECDATRKHCLEFSMHFLLTVFLVCFGHK